MRVLAWAWPLLFVAAGALAQTAPEAPRAAGQSAPAAPADDDPEASESAASRVPLGEIRRFVGVYNAIREAYVEPVADERLMHSALRGLMLELDPHSVYLDREAARDFSQDTSGAYDGVGLELQQQPGAALKVIAPIEGGPGDRAGLKSGDLITAIDGKPIGIDDGTAPLRGLVGTEVRLTIEREGRDAPFDVVLRRERIRLASVRQRMLEPGYGYVRISSFQAGTATDFEQALGKLNAGTGGRLKGLVLDLRSNPGGLLTSAVRIADDLMDSGVIVSTRGRLKGGDTSFNATPGDLMAGAPVVVVIDAGSASASEVLAGALQDSHRARLVGSRSFGKGSVQTLLPLDNGDAVKLTTARYYTPSGRSIQGVGIGPDRVLHATAAGDRRGGGYSEASLPGHLQGEDEGRLPMAGELAGEVLDGEAPVQAALEELKRPGAAAGRAAPKP